LTASTDLQGQITVIDSATSPTGKAVRFNSDAIFAYKQAAENGQWELEPDGRLKIKDLEVEQIKVVGTGEEATIGSFNIRANQNSAFVKNRKVKDASKIFISPRGDLNGKSWYILKIVEGDSFTVQLSGYLTSDVVFDYWIVQSDDQRIFDTPAPANANSILTPSQSPPIQGTGGEGGGEASPVQGEEVNPSPALPSSGEGETPPAPETSPSSPPHEEGQGEVIVEPAPTSDVSVGAGESVGAAPIPEPTPELTR
jgi:hypothetical protein